MADENGCWELLELKLKLRKDDPDVVTNEEDGSKEEETSSYDGMRDSGYSDKSGGGMPRWK